MEPLPRHVKGLVSGQLSDILPDIINRAQQLPGKPLDLFRMVGLCFRKLPFYHFRSVYLPLCLDLRNVCLVALFHAVKRGNVPQNQIRSFLQLLKKL